MMKIYRLLSVGLLALSCVSGFVSAQQGLRALTKQEHLQRLADRINKETAQRVAGTILANSSLPTEANREQWVRLFVNIYESPSTMSKMSQAQKEKYIEILNEFFKSVNLDNATPAQLSALYAKLSDRLKAAAVGRLAPYMAALAESRTQALQENIEATKRLIAKGEQIADKIDKATGGDLAVAEAEKKANEEQLAASVKTGWSLAAKLIGGAVAAEVVGSLGYAGYKVYTGEVKTLSEFASTALTAGPKAAQYVGQASYNMLPEMASLNPLGWAPSTWGAKAKGIYNRMPSLPSIGFWNKQAAVVTPAANPELVDASGSLNAGIQSWKASTTAPAGPGIVPAGTANILGLDDSGLAEPSVSASELGTGASNAISRWKASTTAPAGPGIVPAGTANILGLDDSGLAEPKASAGQLPSDDAFSLWKELTPRSEKDVPVFDLFD